MVSERWLATMMMKEAKIQDEFRSEDEMLAKAK